MPQHIITYQSVIRDPGGCDLVRVVPDVCSDRRAVVDGSLLLVPADTTAFVVVNGMLSEPYGPGRYELFTGVSPFFVRLRNLMTRGDPGVSVSVFYISTQKEQLFRLGTGELAFQERRFRLTMCAMASCSLTYRIEDPGVLLKKMVGAYSTTFTQDDLEPYLEQLMLRPVREALSRELGQREIIRFNSSLSAIGASARPEISEAFASYGLKLVRFEVTGINLPPEEMQRLNRHEETYAQGKTAIDLEKEQLEQIWGGDVGRRTIAEALTGAQNRGGTPGTAPRPEGGMNGMTSTIAQMMLLSQLLPTLQEPLSTMTRHTDLFGGSRMQQPGQEGQSADAPPPLPGRGKRCPACNGIAPRNAATCPICGHPFD